MSLFFTPWTEEIKWARPAPQETIILLIRHGETFGNDPSNENEYTYTGSQTNFPLNTQGRQQAEQIAKKIGQLHNSGTLKIGALYASPLTRAVETASYLNKELNLPIEKRPELREIDWGQADGKTVKYADDRWGKEEDETTERYVDLKERWNHLPVFPQAEKYNALLKRVTQDLQLIAKQHPGEVVVVATHGRVIKTLLADAFQQEEKIPYPQNCGVAVFSYRDGEGLKYIEVRENH